jgi:hypothetical protein
MPTTTPEKAYCEQRLEAELGSAETPFNASKQAPQEIQPDEMSMDAMQNPEQPVKERESFMRGLLRNHKEILTGALEAAKLKFADMALGDNNWQEKTDRKIECKMIEAQISILNRVERDFNTMFPEDMAS